MRLPDAPMLTVERNTRIVPAGTAAEPKLDGVRGLLARWSDGQVLIRARQGTDMTTVTNVNRGLGNAAVTVTVDYEEDTDRVAAVLTEIVAGMRAEPDFASKMLSELQLWGVDKLDGAQVTIAGQVVCTDSGRWSVQREFNRRMKKRFQELGIGLYNPMRSVAVTLPSIGPSDWPPKKPQAEPPGTAEEEQAHEQTRAAD